LSSNYGKWASLSDTDFNNYSFSITDADNWYVSTVLTGVAKVCCNSKMLGCKRIGETDTCNATTPSS
jgi:hypothetical protein